MTHNMYLNISVIITYYYVAFVDLIKAYDMANHELLLMLLGKYGAPPLFVLAVERMYQDLVVILKIEKEWQDFCQSVSV